MNELNRVAVKLFKSIVVEEADKITTATQTNISIKAFKNGVIIPFNASEDIIDYAVNYYGIDGGLFNATFHKGWDKVKNAPTEQLFFEQMFHYITTYGTDFTSPYVYIPTEELDVPKLELDKIKFVVIAPITKEELNDKVRALVSGIALSQDTVNELVRIWKELDIDINDVKNRELLIALCDSYGIVPKNADAFLRLVLFKVTGSTLKIKNNTMLSTIRTSYKATINGMFKKYVDSYGYEPLADIFNRNKDLFVCLKHGADNETITIINRISKLAKKLPEHKVKETVIDNITNPNYKMTYVEIIEALSKVTIFKRIALVNILNYMLDNPNDMVYTVRNGKTFVKEAKGLSLAEQDTLTARRVAIFDSIGRDLYPNFRNKTFYIPYNVKYAIPKSEKQFLDNIPSGTVVEFAKEKDEKIILATAWETECDIDASLINESGKIGWDGSYRDNNSRVFFSGDMTCLNDDGKACEAHLIEGTFSGRYSINLYRCGWNEKEIPYKFIVARSNASVVSQSTACSIDPNTIIAQFNRNISDDERAQYICNVEITEDRVRLVFTNENNGNGITARWSEYDKRKQDAINHMFEKQTTLNELICICGGIVSTSPTINVTLVPHDGGKCTHEERTCDYDLSLENLSKETLISLLTNEK